MPNGINTSAQANAAQAIFLARLAADRALDGCVSAVGCNRIYFGIYRQAPGAFPFGNAGNIPNNVGVAAVGTGGLAALNDTVPHEVGHDLGRQHPADFALGHYVKNGAATGFWLSDCGAVSADAATWPYVATIGGRNYSAISPQPGTPATAIFGLDTVAADLDPTHTLGVQDPTIHFELMDYCDQVSATAEWVSPITYLALRTSLNEQFAPPILRRLSVVRRTTTSASSLLLRGDINHATDSVTLRPIVGLLSPPDASTPGGNYEARVLDISG